MKYGFGAENVIFTRPFSICIEDDGIRIITYRIEKTDTEEKERCNDNPEDENMNIVRDKDSLFSYSLIKKVRLNADRMLIIFRRPKYIQLAVKHDDWDCDDRNIDVRKELYDYFFKNGIEIAQG